MGNSLLRKVKRNVADLRNEETAAESTEVILFLVLVVIGLLGAWAFLRNRISQSAEDVGNCIGSADTTNDCNQTAVNR